MGEMDELIREFIVETAENLDRADSDMIELEVNPHDTERLSSIFRTIHTVKGTCGFLGLKGLGVLAHGAEEVLSRLREGELALDAEITSLLLATFDSIRLFIRSLEDEAMETPKVDPVLVERLSRLAGETDDPVQRREVDPGAHVEGLHADLASNVLRIDVDLVDKLMDLVGELVLTRNQMMPFAAAAAETGLADAAQRLNLVTSELQEGVMRTRMQPISTVWGKLPRMVRDLALGCGKRVRIEIEGTDTELDKTVIEAIKDALIHMVRNSVDHGIEAPEDRELLGKPPEGTLKLRAYQEGGQVNIEIADDGRGIDVERVRERAIERRLVTFDEANQMSSAELVNLVFLPGFSTSASVSDVSGRGVGMDVVKTNIESIGGAIDIQSTPGEGLRICLKIPLTLAIVPALIVTSCGERFAIPQVHLRELVALSTEGNRSSVELVHGAPVIRLRQRLLPLVWLTHELRQRELDLGEEALRNQRESQVVVLDAGGHRFGLVVEEVGNPEEIVVKPLSNQLMSIRAYSGATIMGDGSVALILDVLGLAQQAGIGNSPSDDEGWDQVEDGIGVAGEDSFLVVEYGDGRRAAISLGVVDRLEVCSQRAIEPSAAGPVVQYRGEIMPVYGLAALVGCVETPAEEDKVPLLVSSAAGRPVAIVVQKIIDIVSNDVVMRDLAMVPGVAGTAVISERVTDLIDLEALLRQILFRNPDLIVAGAFDDAEVGL